MHNYADTVQRRLVPGALRYQRLVTRPARFERREKWRVSLAVLRSLRLRGRCQDHPAGVVCDMAAREAAGESERRQFVIVDDRGLERL